MKTKLLVSVLLLAAVSVTAQPARREGSKSTGNTKTVEKKESSGTTVQRSGSKTTTGTSTKSSYTGGRQNTQSNSENRRTTTTGSSVSRSSSTSQSNNHSSTTQRRSGSTQTYSNGTTVTKENRSTSTDRRTGGYSDQNRESSGSGTIRYDERRHASTTIVPAGRSNEKNPNRNTSDWRYVSRHTRVGHPVVVNTAPPRPIAERRVMYPYHRPVYVDIYWTSTLRDDYIRWYPDYSYWHFHIGSRIATASAYDADLYVGEVARIYGETHEIYYSLDNDEYYLYFGADYPYHDFSVVIPGWVARAFSDRPLMYFQGQGVIVTGLVTAYDGRPEIMVKQPSQITRYYY